MAVTPRIVKVYNWSDIQDELCRIMGIPEDKFRDYHHVVGGKYKDFWHVCLEHIVPESMQNGTTVTLWSLDEEWFDFEEEDAWKMEVIQAWNKLYEELDESGTDSGIEVNFSW